jgi:hypothetical protein
VTFLVFVAMAMAITSTLFAVREWRRPTSATDSRDSQIRQMRGDLGRNVIAGTVLIDCLVVMFFTRVIVEVIPNDADGFHALRNSLDVLATLCMIGMVVFGLLGLLITFLGRPRWLIPRYMRDQH